MEGLIMINAVYIKSVSSLDEIANSLRDILNIPSTNRSAGVIEQSREGLNYGGLYYHFEVFGLTLELIRNQGEVQVDEWADWNYYVFVSSQDMMTDERIAEITSHIAHTCSHAGLSA